MLKKCFFCGPKNVVRNSLIANDDVGLLIRRLTAGLIDVDKFLEELKFNKA